MIHLRGTSTTRWDADAFVARVTRIPCKPTPMREKEAFSVSDQQELPPGFLVYLLPREFTGKVDTAGPIIRVPDDLLHLAEGDVIRVEPRTGNIHVLYRRQSDSNTILLTERCNNHCLMCSQPPRPNEAGCTLSTWEQAIPLLDECTHEIGITGGEPTCYPDHLLCLVRLCRNYLPRTALHILSNGRFFSYLSYCQALAQLSHPDLMIGIPLYSDVAHEHNFIVQAHGAFDETVRGLMNLARVGIRLELRVVVHNLNVNRLPAIASFVARNFPFLRHVAIMGLEPIGFARTNLSDVWKDPYDYRDVLRCAVERLAEARLAISIYNHPLCVIDPGIWQFARKSISDWKREYLPECKGCAVITQCGGVFSSAVRCHSSHIQRIAPDSAGDLLVE